MQQEWEYQHLEIGLPQGAAVDWGWRDKALNDLGAHGWEVVSVMPTLWRAEFDEEPSLVYLLKRPRS